MRHFMLLDHLLMLGWRPLGRVSKHCAIRCRWMDFRHRRYFTVSLARLTAPNRGCPRTTAFDLQLNLSTPCLRFHRWNCRATRFLVVSRQRRWLRLIVHRTPTSFPACYVGHHDAAYAWAERRRIERHPTTGCRSTGRTPRCGWTRGCSPRVTKGRWSWQGAARHPTQSRCCFSGIADDALLVYGVPSEWCSTRSGEPTRTRCFRHRRTSLPQEAAEAC